MRAGLTGSGDTSLGMPRRAGMMTAVLGGLLTLTVFGPLMSVSDGPLTGEGSPVRQGAYVVLLILAIVAVRQLSVPRRLLVVPIAILAALVWCWLSVTWAIDPGVASRRLILTTIIIWTVFLAVDTLGYDRTLLVMRVVLAAALVGNFLVVLAMPDLGIHQVDEVYDKALIGDWRGFMEHKNFAGAICALTVILFLFDARRLARWVQIAAIAGALLFLLKTQSRTSLGVCAIAVALGFVFQGYRARYRLPVLGLMCVAAMVAALYVNVFNDVLLRNLNDDTAFTGRTQIWRALLNYAGDNLWFGSGYGSFWNIGPTSPIYRYGFGWVPTVAVGHNGFLDLLATIGLPGLLIVLAGVVVWPLVKLFAHPTAGGSRGALVVAAIVFCIAHNFTETSLLDRDAIGEVFLMIALAMLWQLTVSVRRRVLDIDEVHAGAPRRRSASRPAGAFSPAPR